MIRTLPEEKLHPFTLRCVAFFDWGEGRDYCTSPIPDVGRVERSGGLAMC